MDLPNPQAALSFARARSPQQRDDRLRHLMQTTRALLDDTRASELTLGITSALPAEITAITGHAAPIRRTNSHAVTAVLQRNRDNIGQALPGLAKYQITQGEAVANGFFYEAFVANLLPGTLAQPFYDYAFGFRRGNNAGQPPDNAGPRAELPLPYNGIPQPAPGGPR